MIIFGHDTEAEYCIFNPTNDTKNYLVGFWGFFPHSLHERFYSFVESLDIIDIAGTEGICRSNFNLNSKYAIEAYNCCDRRTFDLTIILPYSFKTKEEALDWFNNKLSNSKKLSEEDFSDIEVIDGDKLLQHIRKIEEYKHKKEFISDIIQYDLNNMIVELENKLLEAHKHDQDYTKIIKSEIENYRELLDLDNK